MSTDNDKMVRMHDLTVKQALFVTEYLVHLDESIACQRSGLTGHPLHDANIQKAIKQQMKARMDRTLISADRVVSSIGQVAFAERGVGPKEKLKALEMLCKHLGLFQPEKIDLNTNTTLTLEVSGSLANLSEDELANLYMLAKKAISGGVQEVH